MATASLGKHKSQPGLQQPCLVAGFGTDRVVIGVEVQSYGLRPETDQFAEPAADGHGPLPATGDPVGRDLWESQPTSPRRSDS